MTLISPTSDDTLASDLDALQHDGFVVLRGLLNAVELRSLLTRWLLDQVQNRDCSFPSWR